MLTTRLLSTIVACSLLTACGSSPGSDTGPTPAVISALVSKALAHQAEAARWIDPSIGQGTDYSIKDVAAVEVIGTVEMLENGTTARAKVLASGSYRMTVTSTSNTPPLLQTELPTAPGQAPKAPKIVQPPAATLAANRQTGERNFRKSFIVYLGTEGGTWELR